MDKTESVTVGKAAASNVFTYCNNSRGVLLISVPPFMLVRVPNIPLIWLQMEKVGVQKYRKLLLILYFLKHGWTMISRTSFYIFQ
jgi:hypothetical protein